MISLLFFGAFQPTTASSRASLVCNQSSVMPGSTVMLGVYLVPGPDMHTYWMNPGDSGGPTSFALKLPAGWEQQTPLWPPPVRLDLSGVVSYGYSSPTLIEVPVVVPKEASLGPVNLTGRVKWLTCTREICKPADQDVFLALQVGSQKPSVYARLFTMQSMLAPKTVPTLKVKAMLSSDGLTMSFAGLESTAPLSEYYFFPTSPGVLDHSEPERFQFQGTTVLAHFAKSPYAQKAPKRVSGVLVIGAGGARQAFEIDAPVETKA